MNTTIRNLIVALPLATAALTMAPGVAMADGIPSGPGDITSPTPGPIGPGDIANPTPGPSQPTGPGDLTAPQPCPTHGVDCGGNGGSDGGSNGGSNGGNGGNGGGQQHTGTGNQGGDHSVSSIALPTRIDAGLAPAQDERSGLELSFALAGGALVSASGLAFAARRKAAARV